MINPAIGLIVMSASAKIEREFHQTAPENIDVVVSRVPFHNLSYDGLMSMISKMPETAATLMEARPYVIVIPSFTASTIKGTEIVNLLQQATGIPVLVPALEYLNVFKELGISKIGIVSVHSSELILVEKAFFGAHNIQVAQVVQVERKIDVDPYLISSIPVERLVKATLEADFSQVDAVIFDNSYFDLQPHLELLDAAIGRPVLLPNSVLMRAALKLIGAPTGHLPISKYFSG